MTQEEKQLLFKDLCARLPYGIIASVRGSDEEFQYFLIIGVKDGKVWVKNDMLRVDGFDNVEVVRPFLRPMSTMSSKERRELRRWGSLCMTEKDVVEDVGVYGAIHSIPAIDWLNANHFDHRGLIPMGLALPATENMYK